MSNIFGCASHGSNGGTRWRVLPLIVCLLTKTFTKTSQAIQIVMQTGWYFPGVSQLSGIFDGTLADNCSLVILTELTELSCSTLLFFFDIDVMSVEGMDTKNEHHQPSNPIELPLSNSLILTIILCHRAR